MTTDTKTNAREQLLAFFIENGWELDPTATVWSDYSLSYRSNRERIQDPHTFRKSDGADGFWVARLDYRIRESFGKTDNRLRGLRLTHENAEGHWQTIGSRGYNTCVDLDPRYADHGIHGAVFAVTHGTGSQDNTLRQRAELIARDPALVVWLAEEHIYQEKLRRDAAVQERKRLDALRRRPLAITVERVEFANLVTELSRAAGFLSRADGTTDLPQTVADAQAALDAIKAVLAVTA